MGEHWALNTGGWRCDEYDAVFTDSDLQEGECPWCGEELRA